MHEVNHPYNQLLNFAKKITLEAGEYILQALEREQIHIQWKTSPTDLVTQVDQEVEKQFVARIAQEYPDHTVVGEEGTAEVDEEANFRWFIDPIDGTTNFIHQRMNFCISVSVYEGSTGIIGIVYDPIRKEMFWALRGQGIYLNDRPLPTLQQKRIQESLIGTNLIWVRRTRKWGLENQIFEIAKRCRGIRSLGAAALELAYVAAGRLDGFLSLHLSPWDYAAGKILVEEAGGKITDFAGNELPLKKEKFGLIAATKQVHGELLQLLNAQIDDSK